VPGPPDPIADPLAPLARRAARDRGALAELLQAVAPSMVGTVRAILGHRHPDLEDLSQESIAALIPALRHFRGDSSFRHYACRIAARTALASQRRARTYAKHLDAAGPEIERQLSDAPALEELESARRKDALREVIAEIPEPQAETLVLRVVLGHSIEEIAALTEVPHNTVRSRLRLAKEALRQRLEAASPAAAAGGAT
jgi:RNA polymerase sigma-70 factor (ECF subfamily)